MNRIESLIKSMSKNNIDNMIISSPAYIFYFIGEWIEPGERFLGLYVNKKGDKKLILNILFPMDDRSDIDIVKYSDSDDVIKILSTIVNDNPIIGIDKNLPARFLLKLMEYKPNYEYVNSSYIIDEMRMIKDKEEIERLREASRVNDLVMGELVNIIPNELSENEMTKKVGEFYAKYGTHKYSFEPLIAYGANAGEPHHDSDDTKMQKGDSIILDIGGLTNYYCSDMTRTIFNGEPTEEVKKIYNIVLEANKKAIEIIKPGIRFSDIDKAARKVIEDAGYGEYFTHRTGHNIGIEVHEFPDVSSVNDMIVKPGMVFSIEPGIYIHKKCGVRIEDLVVVTEDGCEVLNKYNKDVIIK